ncbi:MAG: AMP-binding protein, partial [Alphaproteobacteria bacterium]|nr:AMP-binding protein [Alphaproteobacteria bacterium]
DGARDGELLERIIAHCERNLARFKVPRYYGFVETLPRTASNKVAKHLITPAGTDPCAGMFDRTTGTWLAHRR